MIKNKTLIAIVESNGFYLDWELTQDKITTEQNSYEMHLYEQFSQNQDLALYNMGFALPEIPLSPSVDFLRNLTISYVKELSRIPDLEFMREKAIETAPIKGEFENILDNVPYINGMANLTSKWLKNVRKRLDNVFISEISQYSGTVSEYFATKTPRIHPAGRIYFHLVENKDGECPFAFLATYSTGYSPDGKSRHLPLKNALIEYKSNKSKLLELLSTVSRAATKSAFIKELLDSGEIFHPLNLNNYEAYTFLKEIPLYEDSGVLCRIPDWWRNKSQSIRLSVNIGEKSTSGLGLEALVSFNIQLALGDEKMSPKEIRELLTKEEGLILIKGKWVEVNHDKLKEALAAYEKASALAADGNMTMIEALKFQMQVSSLLTEQDNSPDVAISNGKWLKNTLSRLTRPESIDDVTVGDNFNATLREYQKRGLAWLNQMKALRLGACLADDMGLGKTIQVIALINHHRSKGKEKTLLIVPASLIGNWTNELSRFAPSIRYKVLHPSEHKAFNNSQGKSSIAADENIPNLFDENVSITTDEELPNPSDEKMKKQEAFENVDLFISTYGMFGKYEWIKDTNWDLLILDEAQAIKNPGTKQTRNVKELKAKFRIAMTGTPVENRLSDLWSLFDFLNKGLLGTPKEFTLFTGTLKGKPQQYARLKAVVNPFILRRMKTDKSIISDLPDKIEMKSYAVLTKKQAALYKGLVDSLSEKILEASGIERKGLVLSSIMKFKQICNHPDQYLGQSVYTYSDSGKYERLKEICETIYEKRERVLVFTQFKEITEHLKEFLESIFHHKGLVLHGETPVAKRKTIVEQFQGNDYVPFLVLSVKAGGVGLNLTKANHVIHFDRWWNPAVENQATDRAFRIGQQKNVVVHKFITRGTIEEKIDQMIEDKMKLSGEIIPDMQESWITELSNDELMNLFKLS